MLHLDVFWLDLKKQLRMSDIWDGIIIGGVGGAIAALTVSLVVGTRQVLVEKADKDKVYKWMKFNTKDDEGDKYRSTRAIASWNNLTEDRARYICSIHTEIYLSTGREKDMWSIYDRGDRSVYEKRDLLVV